MKFRIILATVASVLFGTSVTSALAQDLSKKGKIDEVIVVAQKQPYRGDVPLESLPQQVQLISGEMIEKTGKLGFQQALDLAGGVARQNGFGGCIVHYV